MSIINVYNEKSSTLLSILLHSPNLRSEYIQVFSKSGKSECPIEKFDNVDLTI